MPKPPVRKPLRKGTLVYHGTSYLDDFDMLEGPAWVSDSYAVAKEFIGWAGGEGTPRILTFKIVAPPSLVLIQKLRDAENLAVWLGEKYGLGSGEDFGASISELAKDLCSVGRREGIDGWHVPNNYPGGGPGAWTSGARGSDTMICAPERFLELVSVEKFGVASGRRRRFSRP
jgi:hypothetical protein